MASEPRHPDPNRVLDILGTPLLLRILYGLGQGLTPLEAVPDGSDPQQVETAVQRLVDIGAARYSTDDSSTSHPEHVTLTAKGRRVVEALQIPPGEPAHLRATDDQ